MNEHKLVNDTLIVQRDADGKGEGVVAICTCGWNSGPRFSAMTASALFSNHQDECERELTGYYF